MHTAVFENVLDQSCCQFLLKRGSIFFFFFFVIRNILLLHGARCCPNHVHEGRIDAGNLDIHTYGSIALGANGIMDLITKLKVIKLSWYLF